MEPLPRLAEIESIAGYIDGIVPPTPQFEWPLLSARAQCELWVKHENHTPIGSFKVRGALQYFARLAQRAPDVSDVIAATRGNYGQAIAFGARLHRIHATIVVPHGNSREKNAAMRALGGELIEHGNDFQAALEHAELLADERSLHFVPSFHRDLVWGHAVSTLRFLRSTPLLARVYVPIGLGSGICGMIAARDALGLSTRIVGVASENAKAIALSFGARRVVSSPAATRIADGMACSTPNVEAFEHMLRGVDHITVVSDDEVEAAMRAWFTDTHNVAEGAAGAALAAVLRERDLNAGQRIGVVCTGGNVDREVFARVLAGG